jgi:hypothetical protein
MKDTKNLSNFGQVIETKMNFISLTNIKTFTALVSCMAKIVKKCFQNCLVIFVITGFLVAADPSIAQEFRKAGTAGFVFLEIPVSARMQAMGETGISMPDMYSEGLFVNPGLVALAGQPFSVNVTYANWYVETNHMAAGLSYKIPMIGTIGLSIVSFDFGTIQKTRVLSSEEFGTFVDLGSYTANAYALGLTYARSLTEKFSMGVTAKYVRETIDQYYADNFVFDLGFIYLTGFESLRIAAYLQNFGLETAYVGDKFRMPQILKMGISYDVIGELQSSERLTLLAEAVHPSDAGERVHVGLEGVLLGSVILRGGYKFGYDDEDFTLGVGLRFNYRMNRFDLNFSYMQHEYLDNTLRYTLMVNF